jgi:hypothetical protein
MTLASIARGLLYPNTIELPTQFVSTAMAAATDKHAMIGQIYIDGRPAGTKTLSTGTIQYRTGSVTFANGATTVDIGIQGVATGSGPITRPDGTFSVKTTLTGGGGGISNNAWNTATMNSGTVSLAHGDFISVVFDMTARGGADTIAISTGVGKGAVGTPNIPTTNVFTAGAWQTSVTAGAGRVPNVVIVFDDGTLGWIDFTMPISIAANSSLESFQDSTNPDERGVIFQVPWDCKIDALWMYGGVTDANSDFSLKLYSDPTGTPSALATIAVLGENLTLSAANGLVMKSLATEISLTRNTDYMVSVLATGTSNTRLAASTLANTAHLASVNGGTTIKKATRNGSSGAFTAESPAITVYELGVRISQLHDTGSSGGGGQRVISG